MGARQDLQSEAVVLEARRGGNLVNSSEAVRRFDLEAEIARFPPDGPSGRRAEILLKEPHLRVVLVTMRAGTELQEHSAPGPITIQPLSGRFAFIADEREQEIATGTLVSVDGGVRHTVRALDDGAFLLTIAWSGSEAR
jgi:quercetin dioxygenase-like cupin family protein